METTFENRHPAKQVLKDLLWMTQQQTADTRLHLGHALAGAGQAAERKLLGLRSVGVNEHFLPAVLQAMGIRSITFDRLSDPRPVLALNRLFEDNQGLALREIMEGKEAMLLLQLFFQNAKSFAFDDWSTNPQIPELWQPILDKVLLPLEKRNLDFIFYPGDPTSAKPGQLMEFFSLLESFSGYGKVTLAMEESEQAALKDILFPSSAPDAAGENSKLRSLLFSRHIHALLIYSPKQASIYLAQTHFRIKRREVPAATALAGNARDHFIAGFTAGILMGLGHQGSLALGLTVFGSNGPLDKADQHVRLQGYLREWISEF